MDDRNGKVRRARSSASIRVDQAGCRDQQGPDARELTEAYEKSRFAAARETVLSKADGISLFADQHNVEAFGQGFIPGGLSFDPSQAGLQAG